MAAKNTSTGIAVFSYGFRIFFLLAALFASTVIPVWMMVWSGHWSLSSPFSPQDWHKHEMLFGYCSPVIAGFLLTAVPNWTGRPPKRGFLLAGLAALWITGRVVMFAGASLAPFWVAIVDASFVTIVALVMLRELILAGKLRNIIVLVPISVLVLSDLGFHYEVATTGTTQYGFRAGLSAVVILISLIGGRVIPAFTRNWLLKRKETRLPAPFALIDKLALLSSVLALSAWTIDLPMHVTFLTLMSAAILQIIRLARWRGERCLSSAILLMLHVAYLCLPVGLSLLAVSTISPDFPQAAGVHMLGIGAIGGMTMAVMMRATLGHTGRALAAGKMLSAAFVFVILASILRAFFADTTVFGQTGLILAAGVWTVGFTIFCLRLAPLLVRKKM